MQKDYDLHDIIEMKKPHACQTNRWQIIRMGMDTESNAVTVDIL